MKNDFKFCLDLDDVEPRFEESDAERHADYDYEHPIDQADDDQKVEAEDQREVEIEPENVDNGVEEVEVEAISSEVRIEVDQNDPSEFEEIIDDGPYEIHPGTFWFIVDIWLNA